MGTEEEGPPTGSVCSGNPASLKLFLYHITLLGLSQFFNISLQQIRFTFPAFLWTLFNFCRLVSIKKYRLVHCVKVRHCKLCFG